MFAMGNDEHYISPYLLRPLRPLEEVLGGRGRPVEAARGGGEATRTGGDRSGRLRAAAEHDRLPHTGRSTDHT